MSQFPKRCIFCGQSGKMTSEHIFGDWILREKFLPRTHQKHGFASIYVPHPGDDRLIESRIRAGDPLSSNVPEVCPKCNSGWLSRIQDKAIPHLTPLFRGELSLLKSTSQSIIATWACMATMTGEFLTRKHITAAVAQEDRIFLWRNNFPPSNWRIWIAKCNASAWPAQWLHVTARISNTENIKGGEVFHLDRPNIQTTTFRVGDFYVFSMSAIREFRDIVGMWDWRTAPRANNLLWQIWPPIHTVVPWGINELAKGDGEYIAMSYKRYSDELAKRAGYVPPPERV